MKPKPAPDDQTLQALRDEIARLEKELAEGEQAQRRERRIKQANKHMQHALNDPGFQDWLLRRTLEGRD